MTVGRSGLALVSGIGAVIAIFLLVRWRFDDLPNNSGRPTVLIAAIIATALIAIVVISCIDEDDKS